MDLTFEQWVGSLAETAENEFDRAGVFEPGTVEFLGEIFEVHGAVSENELRRLWLVRQVDLARTAVALVGADLRATTEKPPPPFDFQAEADAGIRLAYWGQYASSTVMGITAAAVTAEVADFIQEQVMEDLNAAWPTCPQHNFGLYVRSDTNPADWFCRRYGHSAGAIGDLRH